MKKEKIAIWAIVIILTLNFTVWVLMQLAEFILERI